MGPVRKGWQRNGKFRVLYQALTKVGPLPGKVLVNQHIGRKEVAMDSKYFWFLARFQRRRAMTSRLASRCRANLLGQVTSCAHRQAKVSLDPLTDSIDMRVIQTVLVADAPEVQWRHRSRNFVVTRTAVREDII